MALAAALLALAACGDARESDGVKQQEAGTEASAAAPTDPAAAQPAPAQPQSPEDAAREAVNDSVGEARLYQRRVGSMEDYRSCMAKTQGADPAQRAVLEAACKHARGAPR
jgi:hypothetical protein